MNEFVKPELAAAVEAFVFRWYDPDSLTRPRFACPWFKFSRYRLLRGPGWQGGIYNA